MKDKHLHIRIEQCLALAKASNCSRRKFGALLMDPERNVILMDGYNGGPRGGGNLCGGNFCLRDGVPSEAVVITPDADYPDCYVLYHHIEGHYPISLGDPVRGIEAAESAKKAYIAAHPSIESGTCTEIGCHHAEMNVICNAAAGGVKTAGAWLIVNGESCMMCSKLIHHAGITRVYVVDGGYMGHNGIKYLQAHGVDVVHIEGPKDPRLKV